MWIARWTIFVSSRFAKIIAIAQCPPTNGHAASNAHHAAVFAGTTALTELKRSFSTLLEYLYRDNSFPNGCFLLTGTGIVPPDDFTLQQGDEIHITITGIGTLINYVA